MDIKFFYDIPYIREIIGYLLIPFLIIIIVFSVVLLILSTKYKDSENPIYKYKINLASLLLSIFLVCVFLAILTGFSIAFKEQVSTIGKEAFLSNIVIYSPIIPILALIILLVKVIKVIKNKPNKKEVTKIEDNDNLKIMLDESNNKNNEEVTIKIEEIKDDNPIKIETDTSISEEKTNNTLEKIDTDENEEEIELL